MALTATARTAVRVGPSPAVLAFRKVCKHVPRLVSMYDLPYTPAEVRHLVALNFRRNADVSDPRAVQMLLAKLDMELEELVRQWKQRPHVLAMLKGEGNKRVAEAEKDPFERADFVERFIQGNL